MLKINIMELLHIIQQDHIYLVNVLIMKKKNSIVKRYIGNQGDGVSIGGIIILNTYPEYRDEQNKCSIHYSEYWKNKNIYYD